MLILVHFNRHLSFCSPEAIKSCDFGFVMFLLCLVLLLYWTISFFITVTETKTVVLSIN